MANFSGSYSVEINLDQVRKIEKLNVGVRVTYVNGDEEIFKKDDENGSLFIRGLDIPYGNWSTVPAQPGFEVVSFWFEDGEAKVWTSPVIAWKIDSDGGMTVNHIGIAPDCHSGMDKHALVCPGGLVLEKWGARYENVDEWLKATLKEAEGKEAAE